MAIAVSVQYDSAIPVKRDENIVVLSSSKSFLKDTGDGVTVLWNIPGINIHKKYFSFLDLLENRNSVWQESRNSFGFGSLTENRRASVARRADSDESVGRSSISTPLFCLNCEKYCDPSRGTVMTRRVNQNVMEEPTLKTETLNVNRRDSMFRRAYSDESIGRSPTRTWTFCPECSHNKKYSEALRGTKLTGNMNQNLSENLEMDEICLHAFIHRTSVRSCMCGACADLVLPTKNTARYYKELARGQLQSSLSDSNLTVSNFNPFLATERFNFPKASTPRRILSFDLSSKLDVDSGNACHKTVKHAKNVKYITEEDFNKRLRLRKRRNQFASSEVDSTSFSSENCTSKEAEMTVKVILNDKKEAMLVSIERKCSFLLSVSRIKLILVIGIFWFAIFRPSICDNVFKDE